MNNDCLKIDNKRFSIARLLVSIVLSGLSLVGCKGNTVWQEEVKLSTGEIIKINREVVHAGGGAAWPQGQGSVPMEYIVRFKYPTPTSPLVEWHSTKLEGGRTYAELPLVLDISSDKEWFIFTKLTTPGGGCTQYLKYELKNGAWVENRAALADGIETVRPPEYEYKNGVWGDTPLPDGAYRTNLFLAAGGNKIEGLITIAEKNEVNANIGFIAALRRVGPKRFSCVSNYSGPNPPRGSV